MAERWTVEIHVLATVTVEITGEEPQDSEEAMQRAAEVMRAENYDLFDGDTDNVRASGTAIYTWRKPE